MQSWLNSFLGDVVLDSFNNASRGVDNIWDKICLIGMILNFHKENAYKHWSSTMYNPILWLPCCRVLYFLKYALSSIPLRILNLYNQKYLLLIFLFKFAVFIPICQVNVVEDDISSKTIRLWLQNTVVLGWNADTGFFLTNLKFRNLQVKLKFCNTWKWSAVWNCFSFRIVIKKII